MQKASSKHAAFDYSCDAFFSLYIVFAILLICYYNLSILVFLSWFQNRILLDIFFIINIKTYTEVYNKLVYSYNNYSNNHIYLK